EGHGQGAATDARPDEDAAGRGVGPLLVDVRPGHGRLPALGVARDVEAVRGVLVELDPGKVRGVEGRGRDLGHPTAVVLLEPAVVDDRRLLVALLRRALAEDAVEAELPAGPDVRPGERAGG